MIGRINITTFLMWGLLFVCFFTSSDWGCDFSSAQGEIFRFDRIRLFGQASIYHLFAKFTQRIWAFGFAWFFV